MNIPIICLFLLIILISTTNIESYSNFYLGQPTKCFDCERQLSSNNKYLGGPSKCFDCEAQYVKTHGPEYADLAQPTKCFDCEKQFANSNGSFYRTL